MSGASSKLIVGIAGGIGSGKSTVAHMLVELGARLIDADAIGHQVLDMPGPRGELLREWDNELLDESGRIKRSRLAQQAFASRENLRHLNAIVHPPLLKELTRRVDELCACNHCPVVVIDAALLFEWGLASICDRMVFVHTDARLRQTRVEKQRGWAPAELDRRESLQLPLRQKERQAGYVIDNSRTPAHTRRQVQALWQKLVTTGKQKKKSGNTNFGKGRISQGG